MKVSNCKIIGAILLMSFVATTSCHSQTSQQNKKSDLQSQPKGPQLDEYVVEVFEDTKGNLWFGTINSGAARYDPSASLRTGGKALTYFTTADGLSGNTVTSFAEDKEGNMWFGTHTGLSKYDGKTFTRFTTADGLVSNTVSELLIDTKGILWVGTWRGVSRLDPVEGLTSGRTTFSTFTLPVPDVVLLPYQTTMNWVTEIIEDKRGNIWISRDGYGVCKYDGQTFTLYTRKDGLVSNNIQEILEDSKGNIWFGSRVVERDNPDKEGRTGEGGLSRFNPSAVSARSADEGLSTGSIVFTHFPEIKGLSKNEIYSLYEDSKGNIWIGANGFGVYCYNGKDFTLISETDRKDLIPNFGGIQSIFEDSKGNLWFGLSGGLFRLKGNSIINVTQEGPWD